MSGAALLIGAAIIGLASIACHAVSETIDIADLVMAAFLAFSLVVVAVTEYRRLR